jgi:hypothetical protein
MTTLSDEEREGLNPEEIKAIESEEGDELDDLLPEDEVKAEAEEGAKTSEAALPDGPGFVPFPSVPPDQLESLRRAFEDAKEQFDAGDINYAELDEAKDAYNQAKWKNEFSADANRAMIEEIWKNEQKRFLNENPQFKTNATLNVALVTAVNRLIETPEGQQMSDREVLEAARRKVDNDLTLLKNGGMAASEGVDRGGGSYDLSYLDKLEGPALQAAIDKLTPEEMERYENE